MVDPKSISFGPGNLGLATPITGMARPAMGVYAQQQQEEKIRKVREAEAQRKAVEGNQAFGEELFREKFSSLDTQRNQYKNTLLNGLRESWNKANLQYSAKGQSIPLEVKQDLDKRLQGFRNEWEQVETAYNYSQGILEQAEKDKSGIYNLNGLREALIDVPTNEEGNFDFTKYNERYIQDKIKKDADVLYNLPKVAEQYAKTLAETTLEGVKDLGNGRYDEIANKANGLVKIHYDRSGKPSLYAPDGSIQLDVSNEAIGRARQHPVLGAAMDAMIKKGKAENFIDAYQQIASGQLGIEQKVDRQGSIKGSGRNGRGSADDSIKHAELLRDITGLYKNVDPTAASSMIDGKTVLDVRYGSGKKMYRAGSPEFNRIIQDLNIPTGERLVPGARTNPFEIIQIDIPDGEDFNGKPKVKTLTLSLKSEEEKKKAIRRINNLFSKKPMTQERLNTYIKEWGDSSKPKSGLFEDPLKLYEMDEEVVNPEGEELY